MNSQEVQSSSQKPKKVALVHDFLVAYGGAERVFAVLAEMFPGAPIYTLLYDEKRMQGNFTGHPIRVSWLSRLPQFLKKRYRLFLPFFPVAVESFDLRDYDLVISSSGAWSKGIVTRLNTKHIAYLHSPMRYAWDSHEQYLDELGARGKRRILTRALLSYLRVWDRQAAERPDVIISNSRFTAARVRKYYRRDSSVVYPGALDLYTKTQSLASAGEKKVEASADLANRHFLVVSRLTRSKQIAPVIEAFNKLGFPLVIVGEGPERKALEQIADENIRFVGFVGDETLATLYRAARAVVFPSEEDFGMVAAEALSFGTPVIAYEYGGIQEIVEAEKTGELFHAQTTEIIAEGVRRFLVREGQYDRALMQTAVVHLTKERFQKEMRERIEALAGNVFI